MKLKPRKNCAVFETGGGWGDAINFNHPSSTDVHGWKRTFPQVGDILLSDMTSGRKGVYIFQKIEPCGNPRDMFFAKVNGVGYTDDVKFEIPKMKEKPSFLLA